MNPNLFPQSSTPSPAREVNSPQFPGVKPPSDGLEPPATGKLAPIERKLHSLFARPAISLPTSGKDLLAQYLPWLALITGLVMFPIIVTGIVNGGIIGFLTSINTVNLNPAYWAALILFIVQFCLVATSVLKLLAHRRLGWKLIFFASLIGFFTLIANLFASFANPLVTTPVLLAVTIIALYLLFQIRSYFNE